MGPQAPKQNVDGVRWGRDYRGNTWIGDELVTEGHRCMSKGYAGPDVAFVHPHERAVDMRSEWEVRLGPRPLTRVPVKGRRRSRHERGERPRHFFSVYSFNACTSGFFKFFFCMSASRNLPRSFRSVSGLKVSFFGSATVWQY